ncbi:(2Fe-2S)-binding protein [Zavarzinia compransoris]|uniref:(2Fe-2S)-binding protein n=1 Tax=Zavarzinia marina TaxID=2911065 RepID=UPI001F301C78|nr:(2Fe-2S)-binding protein [Zavarzinia marina]MCF4167476.1 (2Fe-2S)-binding protein [Zavarzinia marina]
MEETGDRGMYVCNCNGLNERMVDQAIADGARSAAEVFREHECRPLCGRCVGEVRTRINACRHRDACGSQPACGKKPAVSTPVHEHFLMAAE